MGRQDHSKHQHGSLLGLPLGLLDEPDGLDLEGHDPLHALEQPLQFFRQRAQLQVHDHH